MVVVVPAPRRSPVVTSTLYLTKGELATPSCSDATNSRLMRPSSSPLSSHLPHKKYHSLCCDSLFTITLSRNLIDDVLKVNERIKNKRRMPFVNCKLIIMMLMTMITITITITIMIGNQSNDNNYHPLPAPLPSCSMRIR